ncbi:NUDIX hydrolase [Tengunoibacter tsumagoiensis]|uniref:NUDIX hydrolase n=1 Tax=Tengunoibacter tsumagoiensis TaxID=2014871 RepID=UPI001386FCDD|nr:CoA pyrophosphatase [Tengunoibacter tsumagoiensis]
MLKSTDLVQVLQKRLFPLERAELLLDGLEGDQPQAKRAAVLVAIFEQDGSPHLVFIRRARALRAHSGEIAFPGGKVDPLDLSLEMTALRESQEEIGLAPHLVQVLGVLEPVFTVVSNYLITPVVAYLPQGLGALQLQRSEVAELLLIPLRTLMEPHIAHTEQWTRDGKARTVYFYTYGPDQIWGATGRILAQLLHLLII